LNPISTTEELHTFHIAPIVAIRSNSKNDFGWYAVTRDNKDGFSATLLTFLIQLRIINAQNFTSRIDTFYVYQSEGESKSGPWIKLCPVDLTNSSITGMTKDASEGGLLKPLGDVIDYVHVMPIGSHEAKTVWTAWACPTGKECVGTWLKVEVKNDEGVGNDFIFDPDKREYFGGNLNAGAFVAETRFDRLHSKSYSLPCK
jgi:hypothetical protein